ncbi:Oxidoreductase, aldo/keto reductase family [Streptococcus sp. DD11]|uniref:aldo/keto reductase n=1 Tax=Streptococcus sp. DD11 TaxID=1777879 RepID=UPI00079C6061|nr:aldo/keto reductase [Streptococcus sp. DD11]KXT83383.1 Oxidoreductase, aldo/keto reductase family [Streptococcus sp. DD11]
MNYLTVGNELEGASQLVLGCMRLAEHSPEEIISVLETAGEVGINFFDHSDVYAGGQSEAKFAQALQLAKIPRDRFLIQSKCGLRDVHSNYHFDFSKDYIISSVEASLKRLQTDYLDVLLLHRPDALVEPEEVAEAFSRLHQAGKVRYFGVSNQNPYQIELLQKSLEQPLIINQLQFGPAHTPMIDAGLNSNMLNQLAVNRDGGVLDYCRLQGITIQPWSPFQVDLQQGLFMKHPKYAQLTAVLEKFAAAYQLSFEAMVLAWILRHPAHMQPIVGSMNPDRLRSMAAAFDAELSRADWYEIYKSAGNPLP